MTDELELRRKENVTTIRDYLRRSEREIASALPKHVTADRMMRVAMTAIQRNPNLQECNATSLIAAIIEASQLGLVPDGVLGHAYLVPFNTKKYGKVAQLIPGYRGLIDLARRSGELQSISAHVVYTADEFEFEFGLEEKLRHRPFMGVGERGPALCAYAVAHLRDGGNAFDVMGVGEIEAVRQTSRAANDGPWVDHWGEMARKTLVKRLIKYLPVSVEVMRAVALDSYHEAGVAQPLGLPDTDIEPDYETGDAKPKQMTELQGKLAAKAADLNTQTTIHNNQPPADVQSASTPDTAASRDRSTPPVDNGAQQSPPDKGANGKASRKESDLAELLATAPFEISAAQVTKYLAETAEEKGLAIGEVIELAVLRHDRFWPGYEEWLDNMRAVEKQQQQAAAEAAEVQESQSGENQPAETTTEQPVDTKAEAASVEQPHFKSIQEGLPTAEQCTRKTWEAIKVICEKLGLYRADVVREFTIPYLHGPHGVLKHSSYQKHLTKEAGEQLLRRLQEREEEQKNMGIDGPVVPETSPPPPTERGSDYYEAEDPGIAPGAQTTAEAARERTIEDVSQYPLNELRIDDRFFDVVVSKRKGGLEQVEAYFAKRGFRHDEVALIRACGDAIQDPDTFWRLVDHYVSFG